jgi:hypothetical protein
VECGSTTEMERVMKWYLKFLRWVFEERKVDAM